MSSSFMNGSLITIEHWKILSISNTPVTALPCLLMRMVCGVGQWKVMMVTAVRFRNVKAYSSPSRRYFRVSTEELLVNNIQDGTVKFC
nr:MAG TPA: hypothetical protein [Caudoviricetes sp.]